VVVFCCAGTKPQRLHHRADPWRVHLAGEKEVQALPGVSQGAAEVQSLRAHPHPYQEVSVQPRGRGGLWEDVIFFSLLVAYLSGFTDPIYFSARRRGQKNLVSTNI